MYKLISDKNGARRGEFVTNRGTVQTPAFMNVATCAAIRGAVSAFDLRDINCQVMLCNTYHLHVRPGDKVVKQLGATDVFILEEFLGLLYGFVISKHIDISITLDAIVYLGEFSYLETSIGKRFKEIISEVLVSV